MHKRKGWSDSYTHVNMEEQGRIKQEKKTRALRTRPHPKETSKEVKRIQAKY